MKKRSLWILFMSALLCLSMLFAACDSAGDIEETGTNADTNAENNTDEAVELETEARPVDVEVDYAGAINAWEEYLSYVSLTDVEDEKGYTSMEALFNTVSNDEYVRFGEPERYGDIYIVNKITTTEGRDIRTTAVYNVALGSQILTKTERFDWETGVWTYTFEITANGSYITLNETVRQWEETENGRELVEKHVKSCYDLSGKLLCAIDPTNGYYNENDYSYYRDYFSYRTIGVISELLVVKYVKVGTEEEPEWIEEKNYTYYDAEGNVIADKLSNPAQTGSLGTNAVLQYITIEGKNYYIYGGEIIFVDEKIQPHMLPAEIGYNINKLGTVNGYNYYKFGDTIQVVNPENYTIVANYTVPYTTSYTVDLLADGKVYVKAYSSDNKEISDSEDIYGNAKLHRDILFDATTGEAKEVELAFQINSIKTAASLEGTNVAIKDGCHFAVVQNITDGQISDEIEFVILDSNLAKVATLPKFLKNQTTFNTMIGACQFTFAVENVDGKSAQYLANGNTNTVTPYSAEYNSGTQTIQIDNGLLVEKQDGTGYYLYNNNMVKLAEFTYEQNISVEFGVIYFTDKKTVDKPADEIVDDNDIFVDNSEPETEEINVYKVAYVNANGEMFVNQLSERNEPQRVEYYELWSVRVGESTDEIPAELCFFNAYGKPLKTLSNITGFSIDHYDYDSETIVLKAQTTGGYIYYIIK